MRLFSHDVELCIRYIAVLSANKIFIDWKRRLRRSRGKKPKDLAINGQHVTAVFKEPRCVNK